MLERKYEEDTGKNMVQLGALVCFGIDDWKLITINVGSVFSDGIRIKFYRDRNLVVDRLDHVLKRSINEIKQS